MVVDNHYNWYKHMYTTDVPEGYVQAKSTVELYELKGRAKKWVAKNVEIIHDYIYVYSNYSHRYWRRYLYNYSTSDIKQDVKNGLVYIPIERSLSDRAVLEREIPLMLEYYEQKKSEIEGCETKIKLLKKKLNEAKEKD